MNYIDIYNEVGSVYINLYNQLYEKFNINIYACGGTLLGAVRDKGFIQHDNDIDYFILQEDIPKILDQSIVDFINSFNCSLLIEHNSFYLGYVYHIVKLDTVYAKPLEITFQKFHEIKNNFFVSDIFIYEHFKDYINIKMINSAPENRKNQKIKYESLIMTKYVFDDTYIYSIDNPHYYLTNTYNNYYTIIKNYWST